MNFQNTLGGIGGGDDLATTEYVTVTGTMLGPDLPMTLVYHAMVAINSTCSMVIGGCNDMNQFSYYASTHYYHHNEGKWITGPSLMQARSKMASGIITDEVSDEPFIVVTGGNYLNSTEILQDGEWVQGKISNTICHLSEIFWSHSTIFGYLTLKLCLDFYHKHPNQKVVKSFFHYLDSFFRNSAKINKDCKSQHQSFFQLLLKKSFNFISNLNENCSQLSFEVYNLCVAQKLHTSEFLINFFLPGPWPFRQHPKSAF